jgi:hypothetical protein
VTTGEAVRPARPAPAHGLARTLAHEAPMVAVMLGVGAAGGAGTAAGGAGPAAAASCAGALALALLSFAYGRAARRSAFAREHLVDVWAMVLAMVGMAFAGAPPAGAAAAAGAGGLAVEPAAHRHLAAVASEPLAGGLLVVALAGWLIGRILLARRVRRLHTLVSAVVCGGMMAAMMAM